MKFDRSPMTRDDWMLLLGYAAVWAVILWILFQAL